MMRICLIALLIGGLVGHNVRAEAPDSIRVLTAAVEANPKDADAWMRLGRAHLNMGDWDAAKRAFGKASRSHRKAEAYNGIGLAYLKGGDPRRALPYFRRALSKDRQYVEAQLNLAKTYVQMGHSGAESALKKAIAMDSTSVMSYQALADWYIAHDEMDELEKLYKAYLRIRPDDMDAYYRLGVREVARKRFESILAIATALRLGGVYEPRWLPIEAQAHAAKGDFYMADRLFSQFLVSLPEGERAHYEDLSLIARPEELEALEKAEDRRAFLKAFWQKRDPTLTSWGLGRKVEHYRRVWYARTFFSDLSEPWDRRGEVYIRFGEPDYQSSGDRLNDPVPAEVAYLKTQLRQEVWRATVASKESAWDRQVGAFATPDGRDGQDRLDVLAADFEGDLRNPSYPMVGDAFGNRWKSWVYLHLGDGVEFVFVRWMDGDAWDFPPGIESSDILQLQRVSWRNHPRTVYDQIVADTPDYFTLPCGAEPLDFYYDLATFRADDGGKLDVYYAIPMGHLTPEGIRGMEQLHVERTVALSDRLGDTVVRSSDELVLDVADLDLSIPDQFCIDVATLSASPGTYRLAVQMTDRGSGAMGVYVQEVEIPSFADSLMLSDLALANLITTRPQQDKYRKGDVWVIPMPSRSYLKEQNPHVYYEVYNLSKDAFGQTHYRVTYSVRRDRRRGVGVFGALASVVRKVITSGKPEVSLSYEHTGFDESEPVYFELQATDLTPGLSELNVTVKDLNSNQTATRRAMFLLGEDFGEKARQNRRLERNARDFAREIQVRRREQAEEARRKAAEIREIEKQEREEKRLRGRGK